MRNISKNIRRQSQSTHFMLYNNFLQKIVLFTI